MKVCTARNAGLLLTLVCLTVLLFGWVRRCGEPPYNPETVPSATGITQSTSTQTTAPTIATLLPSPTPRVTTRPVPALTPTPRPEPSATPAIPALRGTASPSAAGLGGPTIDFFGVDVALADPGDTINLTWTSSGASEGVLYKLMYSGQLPASGIDVPTTGSITYTIPVEEQNWISFLLYVWNDAEQHDTASATLRLRCQWEWFFSPPPEDICPTEPIVGQAAEQHFERGTMIWVQAEDAIYALYSGESTTMRWNRFEDHWNEGDPDRDPEIVAPSGYQQPIRGFGLIWRETPGVRDQLGWAVDQEQGFTTVEQRTTRYKYNAWYLLSLGGGVWYLGPERSSWDILSPTSVDIEAGD